MHRLNANPKQCKGSKSSSRAAAGCAYPETPEVAALLLLSGLLGRPPPSWSIMKKSNYGFIAGVEIQIEVLAACLRPPQQDTGMPMLHAGYV